MTGKIFKSVFITALAVMLACFLIVFISTYNSYTDLAFSELERECEYLKVGIDEYGEEYLEEISVEGARITYIDASGEILFDTYSNPDGSAPIAVNDSEEFKKAKSDGIGTAVRTSEYTGRRTAYCAMLLDSGDVIRVSSSLYSSLSILGAMSWPMIALFLLVLLLAFLIASSLSRSIVAPINSLDLTSPESSEVYDELKPIISRLSSQNRRIARQMSEIRVRESEFNSITSNMSEGMLVVSSRAELLSCNNSAREIFGLKNITLPKSILSINEAEPLLKPLADALIGQGSTFSFSKNEKHYTVIASPVYTDGRGTGAVAVIVDDTEKEDREELRREFTSNISHELKTPLTSISGFAELIRDGFADGEDATRFAGNIYSEAQRLIVLVGDIIRLTQLDGAEMPYDDGEISLAEVAKEVVERLESVAERAGISINASLSDAWLCGNRMTLDEIVYNLVDNAIKYGNSGGYVNISVQNTKNGAVLTVEDNGIGIPKDKCERVFERFYRVDKSHSKNKGGTGLGLSIVKHAVAYHKGEISLKSEEGVGTKITVTFPPVKQ